MLLLLVVFISTNVAVLVLRRETVAHEHFRVWTFIAGAALYAAARRVRGRNGVAD
ncbi:MAG: family permease [Mycobacterium sp.]|nr:family permease [Mycobacterium sp.]